MSKFKKAILPVALSASVIGLAGCSTASSGDTYITSKAGDVKQSEVLEHIGSKNISKAAVEVALRKVLLEKYKDKMDSSYIEKLYEETATQNGGKEQFEAALKQQGFTSEKYKEDLTIRVAQAYMIADYAGITEDKIKEQYEKEKKQYNLAHILISVKGDVSPNGLSDEEAKAKAEELLAKIKDGEDFAKLAKENSTDVANAANGGELGWSTKENSSFVTEFSEAAYKLNKGEVSEPVKTVFGYHLIKVLDTKEVSFDELKTSIVLKLANNAISQDPTTYSKALQRIFDEYQIKGSTSDVSSYISDMLSAAKSN